MTTSTVRAMTEGVVAVALATTACSSAARDGDTVAPEPRSSGSPVAADTAGTAVEWPVTRCGTYSGEGCAPTSERVDVKRPTFPAGMS